MVQDDKRTSNISFTKKLLADSENDVHEEAIGCRLLCLEKICSRLLRSQKIKMKMIGQML